MPGRGRHPEPADEPTLRSWRRIGLAFGVPAVLLLVGSVTAWLVDGRSAFLVPAVLGVLAGLVAVVFLRRVWSEPAHPASALTPWGVRSSSAFLVCWGLGVLLNASGVVGAPAPVQLRTLLALGLVPSLVATVGIAVAEGRALRRPQAG